MSDPRSIFPSSGEASSRRRFLRLLGAAGMALPWAAACRAAAEPAAADPRREGEPAMANDAWKLPPDDPTSKVVKSDEEWRRLLTPEQFQVTRRKGTERAFTGAYWDNHDRGVYRCVACGLEMFASETKFDSGTGWPSFWAPIAENRVATAIDRSLWSVRTEVLCPRCGAHLGHVFPDGPAPTGLRYCLNSAALQFEKRD